MLAPPGLPTGRKAPAGGLPITRRHGEKARRHGSARRVHTFQQGRGTLMDARARWLSSAGTLLLASLLAVDATAGPIAVVTGGGAKRNDCLAQMDASGVAFPTGRAPKGASCADGDA